MSPAETTRFGKYELLDRIAAGGMAEIFRARYEPAPGVTKQVVIKRILPHYAENKAFIGMFTNEAKIVMGLSHGNIAQVFDFGAIDGDSFLAMELVDGHPLSKVVKRARTLGIPVLPPEFCAFICAEMLKGLHYAHARLDESGRPLKIVHRDVSPQNVLISYEGQVKLVDFGIAKARHATSEQTSGSVVKGKYAYFAPEQAKGKELDSRTDVFAAGSVLYELLTGQLPFQGRMMDAMARIVSGQFQKPRELNSRIPPELERVVLKAMALEKADRYQTAEAFQQDLNRFLANNHPEFTGGMLTLFLHLLFEEELVKEGRPVQLPRDFAERAQKWKQPLPPKATLGRRDEAEAPTEMVALTQAQLTFAPTPRFDELPAPPLKFPWGRAAALLVAAALVGFGAVTVLQRLREGTVEITSVPTGAQVLLDGKVLAVRTPTQVGRLSGDRVLHLEVRADGYEPWKNDVPIKSGQHLLVAANLKVPPPPKPPDPVKVRVELPPPPPEPPAAPDLVTWPATKFFLDASRHRLELFSSGATQVKLTPSKTYRVSLLGKAQSPGWAFYVVSDGGALPGTFGSEPLLIKSASTFYAFHVPSSLLGTGAKDEKKPRRLKVLVEGQKKAQLKVVSAKLNFPSSQRVTVTGLNPARVYELTPRQGSPPAIARENGAPLELVLLGTPSGLIIAPLNQVVRLEKLSTFWVTFIDDLDDAEAGRLQFDLKEVRSIKKKKAR